MTHLDGNALAGALADVFAIDATTMAARCRTCGVRDVLGRAMVYADAPGAVVRCAACGEVLATLVDAGDRLVLGFSGIGALEIPRPAS